MVVTLVHIWVKEQFVEDFIRVTIDNHENTLKEPGNIRFDFLSDANDNTKFVLYEVFESEAAVAAHKSTTHYLRWRDTVADWMAQPRQGLKHMAIRPTDASLW
jgi:autoinducer 2-degrading protein